MKVGDLVTLSVRWGTISNRCRFGIIVETIGKWLTVQWTDGKRNEWNEEDLEVYHESR